MNTISPLRPAMTAIAAVIALSSTPLLAQATDGAASQAPVISVPAPTMAPPVVEQAAAPEVSAAPAAAPVQTIGTPVVHTEDNSAALQAAPQRPVPVKRAAPAVAVTHAAAPVETAAVQPQPAQAALPIAPAPVAAMAAPVPAAPVAKTATVQTASTQSIDNEVVPIAIGLGVIALGGGAFAFSRRKRRDEEDELVLEPATMVAAEPVVVAKAVVEPRTARAKALPNGFDLSRFGRHTQAAYRGPTKDNPSHSLKRRLSHASFYDQREREAALANAPAAVTRAAPATAAKAKAEDIEQVTIRMAPQRRSKRSGFAFQK